MLASRGEAPRAAVPEPKADEGPSAEDLIMPERQIRDTGARDLLGLISRIQGLRVSVYKFFDDAFERLVTVGDAEGYPACVDRFRAKFQALDSDLERIAMRLDGLKQAPLGTLVRGVIRSERTRYEAKCDEQVLRQRLSLTEVESEEHASLKQQVKKVQSTLATRAEAVEEALEELRAEAADMEEED